LKFWHHHLANWPDFLDSTQDPDFLNSIQSYDFFDPAQGAAVALSPSVEVAFQGSDATMGTLTDLANFMITGYWASAAGGMTGPRQWQSHSISCNITSLTPTDQALARDALADWATVCNLTFTFTNGAANITYTDNPGGAFASPTLSGKFMTSVDVNIPSDFGSIGGGPDGVGGYQFQTYIHEIGHALGLGHTGPYNGQAVYGVNNVFTNDTWQYSVMSYFPQSDFPPATLDEAVTPQMADILAVQTIYGAPTTSVGNTTYGFGSTAGAIYNFALYPVGSCPAFTIYNTGANNTLNASGYNVNQVIDLRPGDWSSIGGQVDNIGIYTTTNIANAVAGSGNDTIIPDGLLTRKGALTGGSGNDTFVGTQAGLNQYTISDLHVGDKIAFTDANLATFNFNLTGSTLSYGNNFHITLTNNSVSRFDVSIDPVSGIDLVAAPPITKGFTTADVNGWFQTVDGLPTGSPDIASAIANLYVGMLNATPPTATPAQIQANLENFPFNPAPPPTNIATDTFYRTSVAQFVLREFQAAWGVVPSTGAGSQYNNWAARVFADPFTLESGGGMSQALAGTPQFMAEYGTTSASEPATLAFVTKIAANTGVAVGPGALLNVGLPVWQVLQNFGQSAGVIASLQAPIVNLQNLLLAGQTPTGSIFTLPPPPPPGGVETTPTTGLTTGTDATATVANSTFNAPPASNHALGVTNTLSSVDGGGTNKLIIQADTGTILIAGDGPNIKNIQEIDHTTVPGLAGGDGATGDFTADLAGMGSATTFDLAGTYNLKDVSITDIANGQTVDYSPTETPGAVSSNIGNLTLAHTTPLGLTAQINLEMNGSGPGVLTLDSLTVAPGLASLHIDSESSGATGNVITDFSNVADSVTVTGGTHLTLGSAAGPYLFKGGIIDASADTGGVAVWLGDVGLNAGNAAQSFIGGTGLDFANVLNSGGDVINFSKGGADIVQFNTTTGPLAPLADNVHGGFFYNHVLGFTGTDSVNVNVANMNATLPSSLTTTQDVVVAAGDATNPFVYTSGTDVTASKAAYNFVDIVTPVSTGGLNASQAFEAAIAGGEIETKGPSVSVMGSFYDATNSQAVYFVDVHATRDILGTDPIKVVGLVHMTEATYLSGVKAFAHYV
jgi:hypothetical protein